MRPDSQYPRCETWHESVPAIGFTFSDHFHPGSNVAFHTNFARSLDADHPIVLMNANTGERIVHFAELDANVTDVAERALIVRPGKRLDDATRYLVAFRNLTDTHGNPIKPRLAFRAMQHPGSSFAIRVESGGTSLCYSGDSGPTPALAEHARGVNVFLCKAGMGDADEGSEEHHLASESAQAAERLAARRKAFT